MFQSNRIVSAAAVLTMIAGASWAQTDQSAPQPTPPLSGPKVTEKKIPGVHESFGDAGKSPAGRKDARSIPPEVIKRALGALDRDDTPAAARLTDDQRTRIDALVADFKASVESYKQAHKAEMEQARRVLGRDGAEPGRPKAKGESGPHPKPPAPPTPASGDQLAKPGDDPMQPHDGDSKEVAAARATLADLRNNAPNSLDLQTRVWNVLTDQQHAIVQAEVEKFIKSREEVQAREYVHKRLNKKGGPGDSKGPALKADGSVDLDTLPPKMKERLDAMTPAEREKALDKLRERIKNGEPLDGKAKKQAPAKGADKPAPPMTDVPVPAPDDPQNR